MSTVSIMLQVNDHESGRFAGRLYGMSVDGVLSVDARILGAESAVSFPKLRGYEIRIAGRVFPYVFYREWAGNWCWDAIEAEPDVAADILNHVRAQKYRGEPKYGPESGLSPFWDKWISGEQFTAADFEPSRIEQ